MHLSIAGKETHKLKQKQKQKSGKVFDQCQGVTTKTRPGPNCSGTKEGFFWQHGFFLHRNGVVSHTCHGFVFAKKRNDTLTRNSTRKSGDWGGAPPQPHNGGAIQKIRKTTKRMTTKFKRLGKDNQRGLGGCRSHTRGKKEAGSPETTKLPPPANGGLNKGCFNGSRHMSFNDRTKQEDTAIETAK